MTDPLTGYLHPTWLVTLLVIYIPIIHIHDWSLYWLFTSLLHIYILHIYMTDPFTGYLHPYYTYTWLVPLLVIYIPITHIHDWSLYWLHIYLVSLLVIYTWLVSLLHILHDRSLYWLFTSLLHIYMTDPLTGYLHPYYTYTWLIPLLVIYIPITHIHDWSLYWLFASLLYIYMTGLITGYLQP